MITIIDVKLYPNDRRALARAATKAALATGMSLEEWRRQRSGAGCKLAADIAMTYRMAAPLRQPRRSAA